MSPTSVTLFTIMLIIFAFYGFFSFMIDVNRFFKKGGKKPNKGKEETPNKENTEG